MSIDPDRVDVVTFDSYGTVVDVGAVERALGDRVEDPSAVSQLWRHQSLVYTMVSNQLDRYRPFYEYLRRALEYSLAVHGQDLPSERREEILEAYHDLEVYPDVRESMDRLYDAGYDLYILSNGTPEMLDSMVESAGIGGLIEDTISADECERFKPASRIYRHAAARTGTPIDRICHVSALWFDVQGAIHAGAQAAWVNRDDGPVDPFGESPELLGELADVVEALLD